MSGRLVLVATGTGIALVSLALVLVTHHISSNPGTVPLEWQWNLRWESNVAAWWSGSLLALAAVLTFDNALEAPNAKLRRAWITLALIVLFLSLDEVGSLHERMGSVSKSLDAGRWALAIPLALVIAYFSIRSGLALLWHGGRERIQILAFGTGFAILLSVAFQEYIEKTLDWDGTEWEALRAAIEEGSELVGFAVLLVAVGLPLWRAPEKAFRSVSAFAKPFAIGAVILLLPFLLISLDENPSKGDPSDWLASALFFGAALAWLRRGWTTGPAIGTLVLAGLAILASIASVALAPDEPLTLGGIGLDRRAIIYAVFGAALTVVAGWKNGLPTLIGACLLLTAQMPDSLASPMWSFLLGPLCGLAAFTTSAWRRSPEALDQNGMSSSRSS